MAVILQGMTAHYLACDTFPLKAGDTALVLSLGGLVRWDILNYGRITNNVLLQDVTFQLLLEEYRQTVLNAQAEVESSLIAFHQSRRQLEALQQAADAAQRASDISMAQYQDGLVDYDTVVTSLRQLASQQDQVASVQGTVAVNLVAVYRSLGGGWEVRGSSAAVDLLPEDTKQEMRARGDYWGAQTVEDDAER